MPSIRNGTTLSDHGNRLKRSTYCSECPNHQSVMEHGWCPTNYPGRTPFRIAGRFAVLLDFPGFLILDQPPKRYGTWLVSDQLPWSDTLEPTTKVLWNRGVSDQPTSSDTRARAQKSRLVRDCNGLRK